MNVIQSVSSRSCPGVVDTSQQRRARISRDQISVPFQGWHSRLPFPAGDTRDENTKVSMERKCSKIKINICHTFVCFPFSRPKFSAASDLKGFCPEMNSAKQQPKLNQSTV
mmetsp:Transcript_14430/g.33337  ORF Transcript_14430/g.33337 Transcript_14430/m.33337 type:complete len:111 (+) Transcript_14430:506-838(+)